MLHVACSKVGNSFSKNRFGGLLMAQFECARVINPLVSFTFGVHCGVSLSLHAGKGKVLHVVVDKVEICLEKQVLLVANVLI